MTYDGLHLPSQDIYTTIEQHQTDTEREQGTPGLNRVQGDKEKSGKGCTKLLIIWIATVITLLVVILILSILYAQSIQSNGIIVMMPRGGSCFLTCPDDWLKFNQSCYFFSNDRFTWNISKRCCKTKKADLVVINSKEEQDFLSSHYKAISWIGLTDIEKENVWKWVDGTEYNKATSFWCKGEPKNVKKFNSQGENCAALTKNVCPLGWSDDNCDTSYNRICEKYLCSMLM
ncbi:C-type lectin domain family 4 member E-like [Protopterus annectens]|uniref:C-type lectin domain family 4 member E-like n=1 Tax=Protopterus annectens TaxID=7888 RepID=UPI001CFA3071|nr:C-type lectin domain family 4 member E-like [Protopterus annectens]